MESSDLTIEILKSIRDEVRGVREEVGALKQAQAETNARLDKTNARLDETNERLGALEQRQTETEVRLATELVAVVGAINEVKTLLQETLTKTLRDHERRLTVLETRTGS